MPDIAAICVRKMPQTLTNSPSLAWLTKKPYSGEINLLR